MSLRELRQEEMSVLLKTKNVERNLIRNKEKSRGELKVNMQNLTLYGIGNLNIYYFVVKVLRTPNVNKKKSTKEHESYVWLDNFSQHFTSV